MVDLVKKSILFGIGTYEITKEKLDEFMTKMQKEEKITPEEGRKVADEVWSDISKQGKDLDKRIREGVKNVLSEIGVATKDDIESLKKELKK
ncbi:hypothetical protein JW710_02865 [Candidatus Dojkabacteria bacterium]|nr:hypothetical protein [Candidatus Dojkabacteria bacterium]